MQISAFALLLIFGLQTWAAGFLEVIQSHATTADFILYNSSLKNSESSVQKFKAMVRKDPSLKNLVPLQELGVSRGRFEFTSGKPQVLLLANARADDSDRTRLENAFIRSFQKMGADVYMLPIGASSGLNAEEKKEFFDLISQKFDLMISNGGEDIHPSLYNEAVTYSVDIHEKRDRLESEVVKNYIDRGQGFFFGVCRGMQLTAVAYGMKMLQDIPKESPTTVAHGGEGFLFHPVQLQSTTHSILKSFVGGLEQIVGFSWHHQAVRFETGTPFEMAAQDMDLQIPEALESRNGKALLTQFHPEYFRRVDRSGGVDKNGFGGMILRGLFQKSQQAVSRTCSRVLF